MALSKMDNTVMVAFLTKGWDGRPSPAIGRECGASGHKGTRAKRYFNTTKA